jgi:hypothetical protein
MISSNRAQRRPTDAVYKSSVERMWEIEPGTELSDDMSPHLANPSM